MCAVSSWRLLRLQSAANLAVKDFSVSPIHWLELHVIDSQRAGHSNCKSREKYKPTAVAQAVSICNADFDTIHNSYRL